MDQGMSGCTPLDLSKANQIASLEIAVPMFELPQRRVRGPGMKHIAHCQPESAIVSTVQ